MFRPLLAAALLTACGSDGTDSTGPVAGTPTTTTPTTTTSTTSTTTASLVGTCTASHTTATSVLDTTSPTDWVYYDLDTASVVTEADGWDIRMQTWAVETNGGNSGDGGVEVADIAGAYAEFDERCKAPSSGFEADDSPGQTMSAWYEYDPATHEVTPGDHFYYLKTSDGAYHRLRFDGYYEDAGTVHTPGITHGAIDAP